MKEGFDWPGLMRVGLHGLGLEPDVFWDLTPAELRLLLGEGGAARPMGRGRFDELRAAFPDRSGPDGSGPDGAGSMEREIEHDRDR